MSQEKSWTYAEITLATERNIVRLMQAAAEKEDPTEARTLFELGVGSFSRMDRTDERLASRRR